MDNGTPVDSDPLKHISMNRKLLLYIVGTFAFLTGLSHLIRTFIPIPLEQVTLQTTIASMKSTIVPINRILIITTIGFVDFSKIRVRFIGQP